MYPGHWARVAPDRAAVIHAESGETLTYSELNARSNRIAHWLRAQGLGTGDHVAIFMENDLRFFEICWAAYRSGLYITAVNRYFTDDEAAYVIDDCDARVVFSSTGRGEVAERITGMCPKVGRWLMVNGTLPGWESLEETVAGQPDTDATEEPAGDWMLYSSGTTGRPKGICRPLGGKSIREGLPLALYIAAAYGFGEQTVYLSPAPLYHSAPLGYCMGTLGNGGTVVMMERFDPAAALANIERYRVTHSQWVPTMFIRMLKLPEAERSGHDLSSLEVAIHAAAPCPVEVKRQMIEWWGPVLHEYYAGTEGNGSTRIDSHEWLAHPGSVGKAATGVIHICDDDGNEVPIGDAGLIYFEQEVTPFEYYKAPEKTRDSRHPRHDNWSALGDVGYLDADGYLYLTDRKAFMIISGGVNIYPQEIEDALVLHEKVADVAVFGVPNEEMGEEVKAVVQPAPGVEGTPELAAELTAFARTKLAHYMVPRSMEFMDELPRLPTGKLYKRILRDAYWGKKDAGTA